MAAQRPCQRNALERAIGTTRLNRRRTASARATQSSSAVAGAPAAAGPPQLAELNLDAANLWIARRGEGFAALDVRDERGPKRLALDRTRPKPPQRMLFGGTRDARQTLDLYGDAPAEAADLIDALSGQRSEMVKRRAAVRRFVSDVPPVGYFMDQEDE